MNRELFEFIADCPTAALTVARLGEIFTERGYVHLSEGDAWELRPGAGYFVTRNGSSLIAFRAPEGEVHSFMLSAAHCDSPAFRIKENAEQFDGVYVRLATEKYGGMLCASWMDRPLAIAGRAVLRTATGIETRPVNMREPQAIIPSVAIHMNRTANDSASYNAAVDMLPLLGVAGLRGRVAKSVGVRDEDIISTELYVYNPQPGIEWGDYISAPRLDGLQCIFSCANAFLQAKSGGATPVFCAFDNEEVGSQTKQGAASTFLRDVLSRICPDGEELRRALASSFMLSCDNAHAIHPNHPEFADKNNSVHMNSGIVIKHNANQRYCTDAVSAAVVEEICRRASLPVQHYANRSDMPGGSTLGNIANTKVSLPTADIGVAQLAMHSAFETAGARDTEYFIATVRAFYESCLTMERDGAYRLS